MKPALFIAALACATVLWASAPADARPAPETSLGDTGGKRHRDGGRGEEHEEDFRRDPVLETWRD